MTTSPKRLRMHLSDTALILLGRAADSENQMLLPIPRTVRARGKALERVLRSLLRQGFVEEVLVGLADEAWRSDHGGRFGLIIWGQTHIASGLAAILDATTPLFTLIVAHLATRDEKMSRGGVAGVPPGWSSALQVLASWSAGQRFDRPAPK